MNKKSVIIITLVFITVALVGFLISTLLLREKPTIPSKATGPSCPLDSASCSWSSDNSATSFEVNIVDKTTGVKILDTTTTDKSIKFTPVGGHTYECLVTPVNSCGKGPEVKDTATCQIITGTPPPSPTITITPPVDTTPSITPEVSITPSGSPTPSPSPTPTDNLTETPPPSNTPTLTPSPTLTLTPTPTFTLTLTPTKTLTPNPSSTITTVPETTNTPTEIVLVKTTEGAPTQPATAGLPSVGTITGWLIIIIPLVLVILAFVF